MVYILLAIVGALLLFGSKTPQNTTSNNAANTGGTSTPIPTPAVKTVPFYAQNNASTGSVPVTTDSFTPLDSLYPVDRLATPHNNLVLANTFDKPQPVTVPISGELINYDEPSSVAEEQATAWQNNGVGGSNVRQVLA